MGPITTGPGTTQQSCPAMQQLVPQQNSALLHCPPLHGGVPHVPLLQNGFTPVHGTPHPPQLWMSLFSLTQ